MTKQIDIYGGLLYFLKVVIVLSEDDVDSLYLKVSGMTCLLVDNDIDS